MMNKDLKAEWVDKTLCELEMPEFKIVKEFVEDGKRVWLTAISDDTAYVSLLVESFGYGVVAEVAKLNCKQIIELANMLKLNLDLFIEEKMDPDSIVASMREILNHAGEDIASEWKGPAEFAFNFYDAWCIIK